MQGTVNTYTFTGGGLLHKVWKILFKSHEKYLLSQHIKNLKLLFGHLYYEANSTLFNSLNSLDFPGD